jgi:hypothetical protein
MGIGKIRRPKPRSRLCKDCNKNCFIDNRDYFSVKDSIWETYGVGRDLLCMDCMEERLGCKLPKEVIVECRLTKERNLYTAAILSN